jgi:hypothetical protein
MNIIVLIVILEFDATHLPADTAVTSSTLGTFLRPPHRAVFRRFDRHTAAVP